MFEKCDRDLVGGVPNLPCASLVWLGDEDSRPMYHGQATRPTITPKMDAQLWEFVQRKSMDQRMFRALVSYYLNGYKVSGSCSLGCYVVSPSP